MLFRSQRFGFEKVWTPHITKKDLYETSGHWAKFGEELFLVKSQETSDEMALKPMNCPHHTQIFASQPRSYRDMPVRYLETTTDYRDEKTGELGGLNRVRSLTQDDSHVFCRPDQIEQEINNLLSAAQELYGTIDMKLRVRLSYRPRKGPGGSRNTSMPPGGNSPTTTATNPGIRSGPTVPSPGTGSSGRNCCSRSAASGFGRTDRDRKSVV